MFIEGLGIFSFWLKVSMGVACGGLSLCIIKDMSWKGVKLTMKAKRIDSYPIENEKHYTVLGTTGTGKTHSTLKAVAHKNIGVLFFNPQGAETPPNFRKADRRNSVDDIIDGLEKGYKINYICDGDPDIFSKELGVIGRKLFEYTQNKVLKCRIVVDEVHLLKMGKNRDGNNICIRIATGGRVRGLWGNFITQRPALIDNTLYTQSDYHVVFRLGLQDYEYLKKMLPVEQIREKTQEDYSFIIYDQREIKGAYKIG